MAHYYYRYMTLTDTMRTNVWAHLIETLLLLWCHQAREKTNVSMSIRILSIFRYCNHQQRATVLLERKSIHFSCLGCNDIIIQDKWNDKKADSVHLISIPHFWHIWNFVLSTCIMFCGILIDFYTMMISSRDHWENENHNYAFIEISLCFLAWPVGWHIELITRMTPLISTNDMPPYSTVIFIIQLAFIRFSWIALQIERNTYRELKRTSMNTN